MPTPSFSESHNVARGRVPAADQPNVDAKAYTPNFQDLVLVDGDIGKNEIPLIVVDVQGFKFLELLIGCKLAMTR